MLRAQETEWLHHIVQRLERVEQDNVKLREELEQSQIKVEQQQELVDKFQSILQKSLDVIFVVSADTQMILHVSDSVRDYLGYLPAELIGREFPTLFPISRSVAQAVSDPLKSFDAVLADQPFLSAQGKEILYDLTAKVLSWGDRPAILITLRNTTERRRAEEKMEQLIAQLQEAMSQVKELSGFIPICSHCKSIRNDQGFWKQIELYISEKTDASFSHGICPNCVEAFYPNHSE